jgi:hypothetical protein
VLAAALALPFIIRQNAWFEWSNTFWFLELQTAHVQAHGAPSFFIDVTGTYFYPLQLFYAGPMLGALAYPAVVLGPWTVFAAAAAAAFIAASAGIGWTARNLGVPPTLAILPGILFATTPYTVSNLYGRGDWAELVAVGCLAIALGATTSILSGRARSVPAILLVLALASAGVAGTHNLTLLFGTMAALVVAVAVLPLLVDATRGELIRRYALVLGGAVTGLALCGAFLVPNIWLSGRAYIANASTFFLGQLHGFETPGIIFDPLPGQPAVAAPTYLHTQTIVLALLWCAGVTVLAIIRGWLGRRPATTVVLLWLAGLGVTLWIVDPSWWLHLPKSFMAIQFPFRLVTYLALFTVLLVAVLLTRPEVQRNRAVIALLLVATAWQVGLAGYLALSAKALGTTNAPTPGTVHASASPAAYENGQQVSYRLIPTAPVLPAPSQRADVVPTGDDSPPALHLYGGQPVGSLIATDIVASPLIQFTGGVTVAGDTADDFEVLRVTRSPWRATVSSVPALGQGAAFALVAGRVISLAGVLVLLGLIWSAWRRRSRPAAD